MRAAERALTFYFDEVFKERAGNFRELWTRLDAAAEAGKDDTVRDVLGAIISLAQTSPLSGLADLGAVRAALDDPNMVWEICPRQASTSGTAIQIRFRGNSAWTASSSAS